MTKATVLNDWPQPSSVPEPQVYANDTALFLRYECVGEKIAVVKFPLVSVFKFGSPNDEALGGHSLYGKGLEFYSVHQVEDSEWIAELEQQNAVHPGHNKESFLRNKNHYIFTFQDTTLECVATEGDHWKPEIEVFDSEDEAAEHWRQKTNA